MWSIRFDFINEYLVSIWHLVELFLSSGKFFADLWMLIKCI